MRKAIAILIPVLLLVLFVIIFTSSTFLKKPFGTEDDVPAIINQIKTQAVNDDWKNADADAERLDKAWDIITCRVQFSVARDEIRDAKTSIARLRGYVKANDKAGTLSELSELKEYWTSLGE